MTRRQAYTLNFIKGYFLEHGHAPSVRDIATGTKTSISHAHACITALVKHGALKKATGHRGLTLPPDPAAIPVTFNATMQRQLEALAINTGTTIEAVVIEIVRDRLALLDRSDFVVKIAQKPVLRTSSI